MALGAYQEAPSSRRVPFGAFSLTKILSCLRPSDAHTEIQKLKRTPICRMNPDDPRNPVTFDPRLKWTYTINHCCLRKTRRLVILRLR